MNFLFREKFHKWHLPPGGKCHVSATPKSMFLEQKNKDFFQSSPLLKL